MGCGTAGLGARQSAQQRVQAAQAATRNAASTRRATADDHGWELHVAQHKFLSWQQLFVETEGILKKAPFYSPCDNNHECCNVITHVSELQRSDRCLSAFWPLPSSWVREDLLRGISTITACCKMDRWRKKVPKYSKQTKKSNHKFCFVIKVVYNWHCSYFCYFDYVVCLARMQFSGKCPHLWDTDSDSHLLSLPLWPHKSCIPFLHSRMASAETWLHAKLQSNLWLSLLRNWSSGLKPLCSEEGSKVTFLLLLVKQFHGCLIAAPVAEQVIPSAVKVIKPI